MHDKINEKIVYFIDSMQYYIKDIRKKNMDEIFKKNYFQLYGVDVMIDGDLEPYILEINSDPMITHEEKQVKPYQIEMLKTVLDL